jgi:dimethylargininase
MFSKAIVRQPGKNFADGLTRVDLGAPVFERALVQHEKYCRALEACGLEVIRFEPDENHPDSTFVEDTAVLTTRGAIITRPGASSRLGEIDAIEPILRQHFSKLNSISAPGTLDGGDICEAGEHFFIGISERTNEAGAEQLANCLDTLGYSSSLIDIRGLSNILHLKSGIAYLGDQRLVVIEALREREQFSEYERICLNSAEDYAANCLVVNGKVLVAAGFAETENTLQQMGYQTIPLEMSEFQKMDGGLSCLSLRF